MGGKGYKPYKSLTGKKVSGDWEDSDRGAGNKAKRRAGGTVKKKSPTYQAYVLNKEAVGCETKKIENKGKKKIDPNKNPAVREDFIGEVIDKTVNSNTKKIDVMKGKNKVKINPNVGEQIEKPGNSGDTPNANVVDPALGRKERRVSMMKRQILRKKQQAVMQGAGADIVASHDPLSIRDTISSILELNRYEKETGKSSGSMNMPKGKPTQKGGTSSPVMRAVRSKIRQETGKPHGQHKKNKGEKDRRQPGDRKTTPADTIAKRRQSKADAEKSMRDTRGT